MKKNANYFGVWIDRKRATLVHLIRANDDALITLNKIHLKSDIEGKHKEHGGSGGKYPYARHTGAKNGSDKRRRLHQTEQYLLEVAERIQDATSLYIIGPSDLKTHLKTLLEKRYKDVPTIELEAAEKISEGQFFKKVVTHFNRHIPENVA